jgi:hypothetical protein
MRRDDNYLILIEWSPQRSGDISSRSSVFFQKFIKNPFVLPNLTISPEIETGIVGSYIEWPPKSQRDRRGYAFLQYNSTFPAEKHPKYF